MSSEKLPLKVLFDTNVLVAAYLTEGLCQKILRRASRKEIILYTSPYILSELREKLTEKVKVSQEDTEAYIDLILELAKVVDPEKAGFKVSGVCRHPEDDPILAGALFSGVDRLVTGDPDLLELKEFKGIRIVLPRKLEEEIAQIL